METFNSSINVWSLFATSVKYIYSVGKMQPIRNVLLICVSVLHAGVLHAFTTDHIDSDLKFPYVVYLKECFSLKCHILTMC